MEYAAHHFDSRGFVKKAILHLPALGAMFSNALHLTTAVAVCGSSIFVMCLLSWLLMMESGTFTVSGTTDRKLSTDVIKVDCIEFGF